MGKGRILENHGEGRYTIEIIEDRARAESARALAVSRVQYLDSAINEKEQEAPALQSAIDLAAAEQDEAIERHQQQVAESGESDVDLGAYARAVVVAAEARDRARGEIRQLKVERMGLQARINRIDALPPLRQIGAWCADYTEDLAGDVATAEVPGEVGNVLVRPGYDGEEVSQWPAPAQGGATWSASRDGAIQPALAGTPAGVFYHLAMLPGWQKWRPTFRIGTITAIDQDLCDVTLDAAVSSQQGLGVNAQSSYSDVPIYYMDCNGAAFEEGDKVLVAFSGNTGAPMVVGFEEAPRECCGLWPDWDLKELRLGRYLDEARPKGAIGFTFSVEVCIYAIGVRRMLAPFPASQGERWGRICVFECDPETPLIPSRLLFWGNVSQFTPWFHVSQQGFEQAKIPAGTPILVLFLIDENAEYPLQVQRQILYTQSGESSFDTIPEITNFRFNVIDTEEEYRAPRMLRHPDLDPAIGVGDPVYDNPEHFIGKQLDDENSPVFGSSNPNDVGFAGFYFNNTSNPDDNE